MAVVSTAIFPAAVMYVVMAMSIIVAVAGATDYGVGIAVAGHVSFPMVGTVDGAGLRPVAGTAVKLAYARTVP